MLGNKNGCVKSSCDSKTSTTSSHRNGNSFNKPKKVISSKKLPFSESENKSCSAVTTKMCQGRPQKTTQSDLTIIKNYKSNVVDYCKKCGDEFEKGQAKEHISKMVNTMNAKSVRNDNKVRINKKSSKSVQQYYKNENFRSSTESIQINRAGYRRKEGLDTIKEVSELHSSTPDSLFVIYSDSDEDVTNFDQDNEDNIPKLKKFRNDNYFECHSTKSRIKNRPNATSLNNHKCVYRFYLNDRLFPVPLNTDYNNKIRCVECHLPMDIKQESNEDNINGTIQAKVKLGKDTKDTLLLLPIKDSLIIKERRIEERKENDNYVYFGVVKLDAYGNSVFNRNSPQDSLALKYQKGYKEFKFNERYAYRNVNDNELIYIPLLGSSLLITGGKLTLLYHAGQTAEDFTRCKQNDAKLNDCLLVAIPDALKRMKNGIPSLSVPSMEPLYVSSINVSSGTGLVGLTQTYRNVNLYGLTDSLLTAYNADLKKYRLKTQSITPKMEFIADYVMKGKILVLPIHGKGVANITMLNLVVKHDLIGEAVERDGQIYMHLRDYKVKFIPQKVSLSFSNLFNGDKLLGKTMNAFLNDNSDAVFNELKDAYEESLSTVFKDISNKIFDKVPMNQIFL